MLLPVLSRHWQQSLQLGALCAALLLAGESSAQAGREGASDAGTELGEIVVTAEKVQRPAEEVAISVSTIGGDFSEDIQALDFEDLLAYAGNIDGSISPFGGSLRIRGFGNPGTNAGSEPAVGVIIDGVFYGRNSFLAANFFDLEQTEVLRGPQGTLFGKNATAGALNVVTRAPEPGEDTARIEVIFGEFGERVVRPAASLTLADGVAVRVSGALTRRDGRIFNTRLQRREADLDQNSVRVKLRAQPSGSPWRAELSVFHSRQDMGNGRFQFTEATDAMRAFAESFDPAFSTDPDDFLTSFDVASQAEAVFSGAALTGELDLPGGLWGGPAVITSVTGAAEARQKERSLDADFTPAPFLRRSFPRDSPFRQFSQELRISGRLPAVLGAEDRIDYTLGAFYLRSDLVAADRFEVLDEGAAIGFLLAANANDLPLGLPGGAVGGLGGISAEALSAILDLLAPGTDLLLGEEQRIDTQLDQDVTSYAAFGQAEYRFAPRWFGITGLRVSREAKDGRFFSRSEGQLAPLVGDQEDHESVERIRETDVSPRLGLRWNPIDRVNVFATWSRSSKSGGFNGIPLTPENLSFERERANSYELGTKVRLLRGRLRIAATGFWTDFDNLQVSTFRDNRFFILNAAEARSRGVELDLNWLPPIPGAALRVAFGFNDAQFTSYPDAPAPADADEDTQDLSGRRLPRAPRITATITPNYVVPLDIGPYNLIFSGDVQYRGKRFLDVDLDPRSLQEDTTEVNLRASIANFVDGWNLSLALRNLTNETVLAQVLDQPLAPGNFVGIRADRGRLLTASLIRRF